jgi:ecdysteroid kinase
MTEPLPAAASPEHLTDALRRAGALGSGRVSAVAVESSRPTILSRIIRLRLTYDGAADAAPRSLILKTGLPDRGTAGGRQEVAFYAQAAAVKATDLVPRCFETHADEDTWHLLLEDLTDSHVIATVWPLPPTLAQCQAITRARARFHAAWWDDPRLGVTVGTWPDATAWEEYLQRLADELTRFADRLGDRLPRARHDLYQRLLAAGPRLLARYHSRRNITIVNGDAHVWNCFLPKDGGDDVRFFDWDSWRIRVGTNDLAYMMAMHWYPDRRRSMERPLLDLYHATLVAHGVSYERRALDDDYRLSVLWQIATPVWQAANNIPPVIWWNNLERIFLAVDDLGCRGLLV